MGRERSVWERGHPRFRERAPWFGGDLQTLRNIIIGGPPELPGGERLLLAMPDDDSSRRGSIGRRWKRMRR